VTRGAWLHIRLLISYQQADIEQLLGVAT